jgi:hypothetical protein
MLGDFLFVDIRGYCNLLPYHISGRLFDKISTRDENELFKVNKKLEKLRDTIQKTTITQEQARNALESLLPHAIETEIYDVHSNEAVEDIDIDNITLNISGREYSAAIDTGAELSSMNTIPSCARFIRNVRIRTNNKISEAKLYEFCASLEGMTRAITVVQTSGDGGIPHDIYLSRRAAEQFGIKISGRRTAPRIEEV